MDYGYEVHAPSPVIPPSLLEQQVYCLTSINCNEDHARTGKIVIEVHYI